jgi:nitroreductase
MELTDVMRTTFAAREFTGEPVPDEVLYRILDVARFAPSGGNRQGQRVIIVRDRETRRALAELCKAPMAIYFAQREAGEAPWNTVVPSRIDRTRPERYQVEWPFLDSLVDVPVLLVVCVDLSVVASFDRDLDRVGVVSGASVYPFVQNILLAARNQGYGGVLTTSLTNREPEAQALLGLPPHVAIAALVPLGRPVKQLTKLRRTPVEEFATYDRWDGSPFTRPGEGPPGAPPG